MADGAEEYYGNEGVSFQRKSKGVLCLFRASQICHPRHSRHLLSGIHLISRLVILSSSEGSVSSPTPRIETLCLSAIPAIW